MRLLNKYLGLIWGNEKGFYNSCHSLNIVTESKEDEACEGCKTRVTDEEQKKNVVVKYEWTRSLWGWMHRLIWRWGWRI
jgi:hypothetical protein